MEDGPIADAPIGTSWRQVDNALRLGLRGLPGGSSLAQLLAAHRDVRNVHGLPGLTEHIIEQWARLHHERHGGWPTENSGPVEAARGETWRNIDAALGNGDRSLPGYRPLPLDFPWPGHSAAVAFCYVIGNNQRIRCDLVNGCI
jgi:hypothetical protein